MKNFLIDLRVFSLRVVIFFVIIVVPYLAVSHFFPGTANELAVVASLLILLGLSWTWMEDSFTHPSLLGETIAGIFYALIIIFIARHADGQPIPFYVWIAVGTLLIVMDVTIMDGRQPWEERLFEGITAIFLIAMYKYYDSQFIWMIAIPYMIIMYRMNRKNHTSLFDENDLWILFSILILIACVALTVIQFSSPIGAAISASFRFKMLGFPLWAEILVLAVSGFGIYRAWKKTINKKRMIEEDRMSKQHEEHRIKAEKERVAKEAEIAKVNKERVKAIIGNLKPGEECWHQIYEVVKLDKSMDSDDERLFYEKLLTVRLEELVTVSKAKGQLAWNDEYLRSALRSISDMAYHCFDDETLKTIWQQVDSFEKFANQFKDYIGQDILLDRIKSYCTNIKNLKFN